MMDSSSSAETSRNIAALSMDGQKLLVADICPEAPKRFPMSSEEVLIENRANHCARPQYHPSDPLRILLCFPSKKAMKNKPLSDWIKTQIREVIGSKQVIFDSFPYSVTDTGVGEQPLHTALSHGGKKGAVERIRQGLKEIHDILSDYHSVFFMSLESDIDVRSEVMYDKANLVVFEYHSRLIRGIMSRGPSVQPEFYEKTDNETTYGKVLQSLFGVRHDDWHSTVCFNQPTLNSRAAFITDALDHLKIREDLEHLFSFCL